MREGGYNLKKLKNMFKAALDFMEKYEWIPILLAVAAIIISLIKI